MTPGGSWRTKGRRYGCHLVEADRWYPSSKACSGCGHIKTDLTLSDRSYRYAGCGLQLDRDVNAAVNLAHWPDKHSQAPTAPQAA